MAEDKELVVDGEICISCGACVSEAPEYFKLNDEGKSVVIKKYDAADDELIQKVIAECPSGAISLK